MKRDAVLTFFLSTVLSFALSVGAVGCMVTGFGLNMARMNDVLQVCFWVSLTVSFLLLWKWGGPAVLCLLALTGGYLWYRGIPTEPFLSLISGISRIYHDAYGWGYLFLAPSGAAADWPMAALGGLIALSASHTFSRGRGTLLTALLAAVPLAACMVVTDTVPNEAYLFCLMAAMILLILTGSTRRENTAQGSRLTAMAAIPVVLALAVLFRAIPQEGYVNQSVKIQEKLLSYVQQLPQLVETTMAEVATNIQGGDPKNVDLKSLGARPKYTHTIMEVTADTGGILYLRGQDYDSYSGTGWTASPHRAEEFLCDGNLAGDVTVRTRGRKDVLYLPYYPREGASLVGGMLTNESGNREYTFSRIVMPENWKQRIIENTPDDDGQIHLTMELQALGSTAERLRYLTLPGETNVRAKEILKTFLPEGGSRAEKAEAIAEYVRNSAEYDLNTGRMAADAEDFALWFLTESDTGYCVHFATAAVVLLRAADIPARYVTGYMLNAEAGKTVNVTAGNAHAWAEYFVPQLGTWVVLEATPADGTAEESTASTEEPVSTPTETEEADTPTQPQSSASTQPTVPHVTQPPVMQEEAPDFRWLGWLLALAAASLVPLQRSARLTLRRRRQRTGDTNAQALARWQEAERLAKLLKEAPPQALCDLALKAKFSQHTLAADELLIFDGYLNTCRRQLRKQPWYKQVVYRFIFVVY